MRTVPEVRIVSGYVSAAGVPDNNNDFRVVKNGTGDFFVYFTRHFRGGVKVIAMTGTFGSNLRMENGGSDGRTYFRMFGKNASNAQADTDFHFIATGRD